MSLVKHVLKNKPHQTIWKVGPQDTVRAALQVMEEHNIGAVLVMDGEKLVGVFSERDLARRMARSDSTDLGIPVSQWMTSEVYFAEPDHTVDECMKLMATKHIRHLPVMSAGKVVGVISIADLARESIAARETTIRSLENFIISQDHRL